MKVILFERRFWEAVATGAKVHTIRRPRKRPINVGDQLSLRGWEGKAYRSPQRILTEETCIGIRDIWIDVDGIEIDGERIFNRYEPHAGLLDQFAQTDGFATWEELLSFTHFCRRLPFAGEMIQWGIHPMLKGLGDERARRDDRAREDGSFSQ